MLIKKLFFFGRRITLVIFLLFVYKFNLSQSFSPYYTNSTYQSYINYLQNNNKMELSHPLSQPYCIQELYDSLLTLKDTSDKWLVMLKKDLLKYMAVLDTGKIAGAMRSKMPVKD